MSFGDDTLHPDAQEEMARAKEAAAKAMAILNERTIVGITQRHHALTGRLGWHQSTNTLEKLALVASEVGEAVNECRGAIPTDKLPSELADIVLRTCDLAACLNIDLEQAILDKMARNELREANGDFAHKLK